jgi:hypothetical protein
MFPLKTLHLGLAAILITVTYAASPEEVAIGKVPGYLDGQPPRQSDFLTSTFCYCALPNHVSNRKEEAHYFQFEYYNLHLNTTFILNHLCEASADDKFTCLSPRTVAEGESDNPDWADKVCRSWERDGHVSHHDKFCYIPYKSAYSDTEDWMTFNKQERALGPGSGQGPAFEPQEMVDDVCTGLCEVFTGMPYLNNSKLAHNRIIIYEDMDDMCDRCRKMEE